jgi:prepilin-type N-terminal cleavage/methylation domain-containing protein
MSELRQYKRTGGFTLVELMITIFVLAIVVAFAMPSFRETGYRMRVTSNTNNLVLAFNTARAEAAKRGIPVAVVANSGTSNWGSAGWHIQVSGHDTGTPPNIVFSGGTSALVRAFDALDTGYGVTSKATTTTCSSACTSDGQIVFDASGALVGASEVDLNVCRPDGKESEQNRVVVSQAGTVSSYRNTSGSPAPSC